MWLTNITEKNLKIKTMNSTEVQNTRRKLDDKCLYLSYVFGSVLPVHSLLTCFRLLLALWTLSLITLRH